MITNEKQQAMDSLEGNWVDLTEESVSEFQKIVNVLNRYYEAFAKKDEISDTQKFRKFICTVPSTDLKVQVKKFGEFEFLIKAESGERSDSWIHVDGIAEERKGLQNSNPNHPVFGITCLSDLYYKKA